MNIFQYTDYIKNVKFPDYYKGRGSETGKKYIKIFNILSNGQRSAFQMVNIETGDIFKAASWKKRGRKIGNVKEGI